MQETDVKLTRNNTATLRSLTALEAMQATSYAGETPSKALINQIIVIAMVSKINGEPVNPCQSRADFNRVARRLSSDDIPLLMIGASQITELDAEQQKKMQSLLDGGESEDSSQSPPSTESQSGLSEAPPSAS